MPELIDKKRTEAKVFLIARHFIDRPDREVELVKAVIHRCCEEIDRQPTIEAEPVRHGRWSECWHDERIYSGICSSCEKASIRPVDSEPLKFCPKCGARMEGGAENA